MNLNPITDLLERLIGLDAASLGANIVSAAVADHRRELGSISENAYANLLAARPDLLQALTERLVVAESWFFRGGELFAHLAGQVARYSGPGCYRVLSLPCSTGEEPYSLAIALLEARIPNDRWRIQGIDLSERAVAHARRGIYRKFAFRQTTAEKGAPGASAGSPQTTLFQRYFTAVDGGWQLNDSVRRSVEFGVGNLLEPNGWNAARNRYDLVFCRNLLIYFSPAARLRALTELERLILPGGLLAVGHAEPQILAGRPFRRSGPAGAFLFRHDPTVGREEVQTKPAGLAQMPSVIFPSVRPALMSSAATPPSQPLSLSPGGKGVGVRGRVEQQCLVPPLDAARHLADAGCLQEAALRCQSHLDTYGPSADGYCLLGEILQASGVADQAEDAFRKSLYLNPEHRDALTHAMLLLSRRGETARAAALRERLERLPPGGEP